MRYGKGPKQRLRFSKTGDPGLENAYATHFVWPGKQAFHAPRSATVNPTAAVQSDDCDTGQPGLLDSGG